jgi:hypothetical protein
MTLGSGLWIQDPRRSVDAIANRILYRRSAVGKPDIFIRLRAAAGRLDWGRP